ncbi:MAG: cytochrome P450 [Sphingomicrobium sp.]
MTEVSPLAIKPDHVPDALVYDFDMYNIPGSDEDIQLAYRAVQQSAPDIFWTPRNSGHWVATRAEDIEVMQRDYERFSYRKIVLPRMPDGQRQIPLELDPPEHGQFRRPLMQGLLPKVVNALEDKVREVAVALIEGFEADGKCEFVEQFAKVLPIVVFLDLVDLPRDDRHYLLPFAEDSVRGRSVEVRANAQRKVGEYLADKVIARRANPGEDLLSKLVSARIDGEEMAFDDAISFASLVLFGGLDTVAGMLGFVARFLADNPDHRRALVEHLDDEPYMRNALEELLRRHGLANTARYITHDFDYKGVSFREGDMVLPPNLLVGMDERKIDDPTKVDFERPFPIRHAIFGSGPHTCPGAVLARRELRIFLEEWLRRIPEFSIAPGTKPVLATGMVNGVLELQLVWPV